MNRSALLLLLMAAACLVALGGCTSRRTIAEVRPEASPKEYQYKDMSTGSTAFNRP